MSILSTFISVVRGAVGIPRLVSSGIKRSIVRMITAPLRGMGLDVSGVLKQSEKIFGKPSTLGERMDVFRLSEREGLRQATAALRYDAAFPRSDMFETIFRNDRDYLYRMRVGLQHPISGAYQDRWVTLFGNENISKDELFKQLPEDLKERYHAEKYNIVDWNVEEIWHNKGHKY